MNKLITFEDKTNFKKGIDTLANAVKVTLGPKGRNVIIEQQLGAPHITKDGVTVAKAIHLKDPFANSGAQLLKEVAIKVCDTAGDGTTTSTVLAQAIINEGCKILQSHRDMNPILLKRQIDNCVSEVVKIIKDRSIPVEGHEQIKSVATISANNDEEIGEIVAQAFDISGKNGVITVEESGDVVTTVTRIAGVRFDRGYMSPHFITDPETNTCILYNPMIFLYEEKIENVKDILSDLEKARKANRPVFIIAENISADALNTLVYNQVNGTLKICAVRPPGFGDTRREWFKDLRVITGYNERHYGSAKKVVVTRDWTSIIDGDIDTPAIINGVKVTLADRIKQLQSTISEDQKFVDQEISRLSGGVALIKVGAMSEVEIKEKHDRIDDALCAVRSATEEGIVAGGGLTYFNISKSLPCNDLGSVCIIESMLYPIFTILENAGYNDQEINGILDRCTDTIGYDAKTDKYVNMIESGIIDPAKVTRVALESAASIAGLYLTAGCIIVNDNEV